MDSLPILSSDIPQWLQSNGNPTLAKSSENDQSMDGSPVCECGKGTSDCLIHPNTPDKWIASMQDSLVRILALLENKPVLGKELDRGFTEKSCELLAQLDHDSYSWKMSPQLKATDLKKLSKTWPSWGMTVDGCAYAHPMSGHRITETGGFVWPTPQANEDAAGTPNGKMQKMLGNHPLIRGTTPEQWATGTFNPAWVEWLMGWPIGHTVSKHWVTVKSRFKSHSHLPSWLKDSHANP